MSTPRPTRQDPVGRAMDSDREYFRRHPQARERLRPAVPGEFLPAVVPPDAWVRVIQIVPGIRTWEVLA